MFDRQPSMNATVSAGGEGVSLVGLLALGLCTIALLSLGSAVSSALFTPFRQCSEIETPQQPSALLAGEDVVASTADLDPGVRICESSSMEGD
jgi:hypothetical protein